MKKFTKLQREVLGIVEKKPPKNGVLSKNQLIDSYIKGDIELVEVIEKLDKRVQKSAV